MDIRAVFGRNLKLHRRRAGLSQAALAALLGIDRAHVSAMERGRQNVTIVTLWHVSLALNVEPAMLLERREPPDV
jgi:transcriptional regulator with XRE-family HTH domain